MLSRGHGEDDNDGTRQAITDQLRLGEELRKKQMDISDGEKSDSDGDIDMLKKELEAGPLAGLSRDAQDKAVSLVLSCFSAVYPCFVFPPKERLD
jgi:hypothetical protein